MEDNELIRAYVAGVLDSRSSIRVNVRKEDSYSLGFVIQPTIEVRRNRPELVELLAMWGDSIGIQSQYGEDGKGYRWTVNRREDVKTVLELLEPFLLVQDNVAGIILDEIIPRLDEQKHTTKEGFMELMEYVEAARETIESPGSTKYNRAFFEKEWAEA